MSLRRLTILLLSAHALSLALTATAAFDAEPYRPGSVAHTVLLHSGNAALDDAIEEGFRLHWRQTPWSWAADTGIPKVGKDSSLYVFGNFSLSRWMVNGLGGCPGKWVDNKKGLCILRDSVSSFSLYLVKGETQKEILTELSELRSWPKGDAMAVDVVKDFQTALQAVSDSLLDEELLSGNREWPGLAASAIGRPRCPTCTVWVAREYVPAGAGDSTRLATRIGRAVRLIGMDSLDGLLGSGRQGLYLDAGTRSSFVRTLHLRTLDSGVLVATRTRYRGLEGSAGMVDDDLAHLGHRLRGEEYRVVLSLSWLNQFTGNTFSQFFTGGYEFRRGWQALVGIGATTGTYAESDAEASGSPKLTTLLAGVRWMPLLGYEARPVAHRLLLDLTLMAPLGHPPRSERSNLEGSYLSSYGGSSQDMQWNAPLSLNLEAALNYHFLEFGTGLRLPLGKEYEGTDKDPLGRTTDASNWSVRVGIRTEWRGWRKAPSLFRARNEGQAPSAPRVP